MTSAQIREFYRKLRAYRGYPETAICLRLIAMTACRPGEAADAEWSESDFEARLIAELIVLFAWKDIIQEAGWQGFGWR